MRAGLLGLSIAGMFVGVCGAFLASSGLAAQGSLVAFGSLAASVATYRQAPGRVRWSLAVGLLAFGGGLALDLRRPAPVGVSGVQMLTSQQVRHFGPAWDEAVASSRWLSLGLLALGLAALVAATVTAGTITAAPATDAASALETGTGSGTRTRGGVRFRRWLVAVAAVALLLVPLAHDCWRAAGSAGRLARMVAGGWAPLAAVLALSVVAAVVLRGSPRDPGWLAAGGALLLVYQLTAELDDAARSWTFLSAERFERPDSILSVTAVATASAGPAGDLPRAVEAAVLYAGVLLLVLGLLARPQRQP